MIICEGSRTSGIYGIILYISAFSNIYYERLLSYEIGDALATIVDAHQSKM